MSYYKKIYDNPELPSRARLVYMYLKDRANEDGVCWPSIRTISNDLKLSRSTVKRALRDLVACGYLVKNPRTREDGSNTSMIFKL